MPAFIVLTNTNEIYTLNIFTTTYTNGGSYSLEVTYTIDDYPNLINYIYYIDIQVKKCPPYSIPTFSDLAVSYLIGEPE